MTMDYVWTDEAVDLLKESYGHFSVKVLQLMLPADASGKKPTRGSVIGKAWRLGVTGTKSGPRPDTVTANKIKKKIKRASATKKRKVKAFSPKYSSMTQCSSYTGAYLRGESKPPEHKTPKTLEAFNAIIPKEQRVTILQLSARTCRWPVGDPGTVEFFFCGAPTELDNTYCKDHAQFAMRRVA